MKKYVSLILVSVLLLLLFSGCGAGSSAPAMNQSAKDVAMEEAMEATMAAEGTSLTADASGSTALPENRKWIITVEMSAETEDMTALLAALDERINAMNGYVEDQNIYNGSHYSSRRYRSASLTVRVPAEAVDRFTEEVGGLSNVVRTTKNLEDVTLRYTATASRITALETEEARLLDFMAQAENMSDLLEIESRLTDVRYELERYSSQLRLYDNQIDYATIHLSIEEVQEYTPVVEKTTWERIRDGFRSSLESLAEAIREIFIWVLVNSPFLAVFALVGFAAVMMLKKRRRRKAVGKQKAPAAEPEKKEE